MDTLCPYYGQKTDFAGLEIYIYGDFHSMDWVNQIALIVYEQIACRHRFCIDKYNEI